jgi:hypothetical protein
MNYWDRLKNNKLKEIEELENNKLKELQRLIKQNELKRQKIEDFKVKDLLDLDIRRFLRKHKYAKYQYGKEWSENNELIHVRNIIIELTIKDNKIVREVELYAPDCNIARYGDEIIEMMAEGNKQTQDFIDKYQPVIDKIYELAESDNYARTFDDYLKEVQNELQTTIGTEKI